ncbi:MAG: type II secretion system protein [Brachyspira sp.]|nr:type II secretion system protein [Brachyspira sp.]
MGLSQNSAFTLAEVLITLGIIGVVAAMTLPALVQSHTNKIVETRIAKFYSTINQAIKMSEVEYGDKKYWFTDLNNIETDEDGKPVNGSSEVEKWWNKYISPNMKTTSVKYDEKGLPYFYFPDGSALKIRFTDAIRDWIFYPGNPDKCIKRYKTEDEAHGKCSFLFIYMPGGEDIKTNVGNPNRPDWKYHVNKGVEPYKYNWDGTANNLYNDHLHGCKTGNGAFCTALIQYNGWKIPKDYPYKVSY